MATKENNCVLATKQNDELIILYPVTRVENVEGLDEATSTQSGLMSAKDKEKLNSVGYKKRDVIILASNWNGTGIPYTNTVAVQGVTENSDVQVLPSDTITADQVNTWAGAMIMAATQASGSIMLKAFGDKPEIDIPITVLVGSDVVGGDTDAG